MKNVNEMPKGHVKLVGNIAKLKAKKDRTQHENVRLANSLFKAEDKSLSQIYKKIKNAEGATAKVVQEILGKNKMPSFKAFNEAIKQNENGLYSVWNGLSTLKKFNVSAQQKAKAKRQEKNQAKKAA